MHTGMHNLLGVCDRTVCSRQVLPSTPSPPAPGLPTAKYPAAIEPIHMAQAVLPGCQNFDATVAAMCRFVSNVTYGACFTIGWASHVAATGKTPPYIVATHTCTCVCLALFSVCAMLQNAVWPPQALGRGTIEPRPERQTELLPCAAGMTPFGGGQFGPFLGRVAGLLALQQLLRPIRFSCAIALTPFVDRLLGALQRRMGFPRNIAFFCLFAALAVLTFAGYGVALTAVTVWNMPK